MNVNDIAAKMKNKVELDQGSADMRQVVAAREERDLALCKAHANGQFSELLQSFVSNVEVFNAQFQPSNQIKTGTPPLGQTGIFSVGDVAIQYECRKPYGFSSTFVGFWGWYLHRKDSIQRTPDLSYELVAHEQSSGDPKFSWRECASGRDLDANQLSMELIDNLVKEFVGT